MVSTLRLNQERNERANEMCNAVSHMRKTTRPFDIWIERLQPTMKYILWRSKY